MAGTLQSLGRIGQDPQMANRIVQALIESTSGGAAPTRMPAAPPQPGPVSSQAQLMSPEDLPYLDRLFRGQEMPFDIGGTAKPLGKAARRLAKKIPRGVEIKKTDKAHSGAAYDRMPGMMAPGAASWGVFKDGELVGRILQDRTGAKFWHVYSNTNPPRSIGGLFDSRKHATAWALKNKKWGTYGGDP